MWYLEHEITFTFKACDLYLFSFIYFIYLFTWSSKPKDPQRLSYVNFKPSSFSGKGGMC